MVLSILTLLTEIGVTMVLMQSDDTQYRNFIVQKCQSRNKSFEIKLPVHKDWLNAIHFLCLGPQED